jgi:hypothetical protein
MPTLSAALRIRLVLLAVLSLFVAAPAFGALSATATVSTSSSSSPFNYTVNLHNTGDTNIGTFWFAWTDIGYDFLPTNPAGVSGPAGWVDPITHNFPGDGYGIEFYNTSGSPIAPGGTGLFHFTSTNTPATIAGPSAFSPYAVTTSFVYGGSPLSDSGFTFAATVAPEPASATLACIAGGACWLAWRRQRSKSSAT